MKEDLRYWAKDLTEFKCDNCDKFLCYGFVDYCDDCGFLCEICKELVEKEQKPQVHKQEMERLAREAKEKKCGESKEGHDWVDITSSCLVFGSYVYQCKKCSADKREPMEIAWRDIKLNSGEIKL